MRRLLVAFLLLAAALALAVAAPAFADTPPSRWDAARDPHARARYELHARVVQLLYLDGTTKGRAVQSIALERARAMLEDADAAHSPDVRLRFDLGEVYEDLHRYEQAAAVLQPAVDEFPDHPAAVDALGNLAYAYAYLDRSKDERAIYLRYIPLINDDRVKAVALLNLAEAEMHLGNLDEAVARYREDITLTEQMPDSVSANETRVLCVWGLAVALDRSGDPQAAMQEAKHATEIDQGERVFRGPNVFFVPAYERDWYLGLAEMSHAREAPSVREALDAWTRAVEYWNHYVTSADAGDRWVALARSHLVRSRAERTKVQARVAKEPQVPAPAPDEPGVIHVIP